MKFLRRLTPVFAYTWSRDSISAAEKARGEGVFKYPLLNRLLNRHIIVKARITIKDIKMKTTTTKKEKNNNNKTETDPDSNLARDSNLTRART